jgi:hypothetical protein
MALTKINENQISTSTSALITSLSFLNTNSILQLPSGNTSQRPTGINFGAIRYNNQIDRAEIYTANGTATGVPGWVAIGAETGIDGGDAFVRTNGTTITKNCTIGPTANADQKYTYGMLVGDITIATNITVTIETGAILSIFGEFS